MYRSLGVPATLEAVNRGIADANDANRGDTGATTKVTKHSASSSAPTNILQVKILL